MSDRTKLSEGLDNLPIHVEDIPGVVFQAAEKYLALLPDEDGNHDPELVERIARLWFGVGQMPDDTETWENVEEWVRDEYRDSARLVLDAITGDTE